MKIEKPPAGHVLNPDAVASCRKRGWPLAAVADAAQLAGIPLHVPAPPNARTMTDSELDAAIRRKAWRDQPAAAPAPAAAPPPSGNTASTAAPPPPEAPRTGRAAVRAMTDEEFNAAVKNRAWR